MCSSAHTSACQVVVPGAGLPAHRGDAGLPARSHRTGSDTRQGDVSVQKPDASNGSVASQSAQPPRAGSQPSRTQAHLCRAAWRSRGATLTPPRHSPHDAAVAITGAQIAVEAMSIIDEV